MNLLSKLNPGTSFMAQRLFCSGHRLQPISTRLVSCLGSENRGSLENSKLHCLKTNNVGNRQLNYMSTCPVKSNNFVQSLIGKRNGLLSQDLLRPPILQKIAFCSTDESTKQEEENKSLLQHLKDVPPAAKVLGFSGLVPFVVPTLYQITAMSFSPPIAFIQLAYGATILSFLGGIRWGFCVSGNEAVPPDWINLLYSVAPSLIAWIGLLGAPEFGITCVICGLCLAGIMDANFKAFPPWFRSLRAILSIGAVVPLVITFLFSIFMPAEDTSTSYNWIKLIKIIQIILDD